MSDNEFKEIGNQIPITHHDHLDKIAYISDWTVEGQPLSMLQELLVLSHPGFLDALMKQ